jgi:hypothetical protein
MLGSCPAWHPECTGQNAALLVAMLDDALMGRAAAILVETRDKLRINRGRARIDLLCEGRVVGYIPLSEHSLAVLTRATHPAGAGPTALR